MNEYMFLLLLLLMITTFIKWRYFYCLPIILEWRAGTLTATLINYLMSIVAVRAFPEVLSWSPWSTSTSSQQHAFPVNSTLTLTPTLRAHWELESVRLCVHHFLTSKSHMSDAHMSYMETVLALDRGMTVAVNQPIPFETLRVKARGSVHSRTVVISHIICQRRTKNERRTLEYLETGGTSRLSECIPQEEVVISQGT